MPAYTQRSTLCCFQSPPKVFLLLQAGFFGPFLSSNLCCHRSDAAACWLPCCWLPYPLHTHTPGCPS